MKVLFFAQLAAVVGREVLEVETVPAATGDDLWRQVVESYPSLAAYRSQLRLARDCEFISWETVLGPAREIAFIPPVSGG